VKRKEAEMPKAAYFIGDFDPETVMSTVKAAFDAGAEKAVVIHRNSRGIRIGRFEFVRG
jgi:hypothetical protein